MDIECDKSIPIALDHENNSHLDDSVKQSPVATSHENPNVRAFRKSGRIRQRRAQESEEARKERQQNARRAKRRKEQETGDERHERQVKDTILHQHC
ncbi:unnamed protein product [Rotaria sp. Silwood2]|nr:unnamed protein product [Rotaria sp. Silwood2]CAF2994550.1 unnamed protein product [Rotaria sp. Silwood2]CAF3343720.1 unnamed protein product [Rotaria sp. Silwood2]CAF4036869.1 unnamed protein product [Rotaria sp. Silwood2]CAF4148844.1 unnamed protein product [Rotaria sp. Silwood2]